MRFIFKTADGGEFEDECPNIDRPIPVIERAIFPAPSFEAAVEPNYFLPEPRRYEWEGRRDGREVYREILPRRESDEEVLARMLQRPEKIAEIRAARIA